MSVSVYLLCVQSKVSKRLIYIAQASTHTTQNTIITFSRSLNFYFVLKLHSILFIIHVMHSMGDEFSEVFQAINGCRRQTSNKELPIILSPEELLQQMTKNMNTWTILRKKADFALFSQPTKKKSSSELPSTKNDSKRIIQIRKNRSNLIHSDVYLVVPFNWK